MKNLMQVKGYTEEAVEFFREAVDCVAVSRCVLKWTYAFAYMSEMNDDQRKLFEFWQKDLEKNCETLQYHIEFKPIDKFLDPTETDSNPFGDFKNQVSALCNATIKFRENVVRECEGLQLN